MRVVAAAAALTFLIDILLTRPTLGGFVGLLAGYAVTLPIFFLIGRWLGKYAWPDRGLALARAMLRRRMKREHDFVFLSDRPDRTMLVARRIWEVVGFAAGVSVLFATLLSVLGLPALTIAVGILLPIMMVWAGFVLVPYWLFIRLGFRIVDPVRWLIFPLSRRYADRLKLSNGALILLALGASANLAFRAGASGPEAVFKSIAYALRVMSVVLVISATAVAYYTAEERRISNQLELECLSMGIRDGRAMSDGDFLPRLPPPKAP